MAATAPLLLHESLPLPRTRLIGRETERAMALAFLLEDAVPLLTLTGQGGVGKTRLSLAIAVDVAGAFTDGVVWVDLAPLTDAALVPTTLASALGVTPSLSQPLPEDLARDLRSRQLLLLLDNCEHVLVETAGLVGSLLRRCPALQVLASSRAPLRLQGEQVLPVAPLPLPAAEASSLEALAENDAVRLFVARPGGASGLCPDREECSDSSCPLPPARWLAAGHRAGGGADDTPLAGSLARSDD